MALRLRWRLAAAVAGGLFFLAGLYLSYFWLYKMAPLRRCRDPRWYASHSQREHWEESQKSARRGAWDHDLGLDMAYYGDKAWAEWIMHRLKPGTDIGCGSRSLGHADAALEGITNHSPGKDAAAWLDWWAENKSKSQEEWIKEGFVAFGVKAEVPLTPECTDALVCLLGGAGGRENAPLPSHIRYNAFRWLRDSRFDAVDYAIAHRNLTAETESGLRRYAQLDQCFPRTNELGLLSFGKYQAPSLAPEFVGLGFQAKMYAAIGLAYLIGVGFVLLSLRRA